MDLLGILGWAFASIFILLPLGILVIMVLERDKTVKTPKADLIEASGIQFTQANTKKPKRGLIAKESKSASKEDIAAGVFGFGKSNGFTLPDAGAYVAPARPDLIAPANTSEPLHDLATPVTPPAPSKPAVQAPQPLQQAKPVAPLAAPPTSVRPLLPPPPPSLR